MKEYKRADAGRDGNYETFHKTIEQRIRFLSRLIETKQHNGHLQNQGTVRTSKIQGHYRYYYKSPEGKEVYLPESQVKAAQKIIQREYDEKAQAAAEKEICLLQRYLSFSEAGSVNSVYEKMPEGKRRLVTSAFPTAEECLKKWYEIPDSQLTAYEIPGNNYTRRGEHVRSKSEVFIADALDAAGIPYRYEARLDLPSGPVYPDFTVLDLQRRKVFYWEHLGMMGDSDYLKDAFRKVNNYKEAGIYPGTKLIVTWETSRAPFGTRDAQKAIEEYFG